MSTSDSSSIQRSSTPAQNGNGHSGNGVSPVSQNGTAKVAAFNGNGNGNGRNGNGGNGGNGNNGNGNPGFGGGDAPPEAPQIPPEIQFDRPVILKQTPVWAMAIIGLIMGVTMFSIGWAVWAKVDEAIPAQGKLEPQGAVKDIQAPIGGVVTDILVQEGEAVEQGQDLVVFDQTASQAELESREKVRAALLAENRYYDAQLNGQGTAIPVPENVPPEMASLLDNRAALIEENLLFEAQRSGTVLATLDATKRARLETNLAEQKSRQMAAELNVAQLRQQFEQNLTRIGNTEQQLSNAQSQLLSAQSQLQSAKEGLAIDERILGDIAPLAEEGGIARIQRLRQEQEVGAGKADVERQTAEISNRQAEVNNQLSELRQLQQEQARLTLAIAQAEEERNNTVARSQQEPLTSMADNDQRIAEIDSQITKLIVENKKRIDEIDAQISQSRVNLGYQILKAPADGTVFDLQPTGIGYVVNTNEPVLKIVPEEGLIAKVFITNRDIGFIEEGMKVDVRLDSFPFSEFGDIEGELISIGDDALPPDQVYNFFRFPAKVRLDEQTVRINGKEIELQSGMSLSVNIKTRPRRVITYFTDLFERRVDSFKSGK